MSSAAVRAAKHEPRFEVKLPQHSMSANVYYVTDCTCGWQSPLCATKKRAQALFRAHRALT
jgi:hypothetical protein